MAALRALADDQAALLRVAELVATGAAESTHGAICNGASRLPKDLWKFANSLFCEILPGTQIRLLCVQEIEFFSGPTFDKDCAVVWDCIIREGIMFLPRRNFDETRTTSSKSSSKMILEE